MLIYKRIPMFVLALVFVLLADKIFLRAENDNMSFLSAVKEFVSSSLFCHDFYLPHSLSDSLSDLKKEIHGQPLVVNSLLPALEKHFEINFSKGIRPTKPLVLRFNGPTGVGKTFVAEHLSKSKYFLNKHFFPMSLLSATTVSSKNEKDEIQQMKEMIRKQILQSVSFCRRSIFVFDDITAVPPDFFDDLPPFKLPPSNRANFNESLFIYISQNDADVISTTTSNLIKKGRNREDIHINEFLSSKNEGMGYLFGKVWSTLVRFWNNLDNSKNYVDLYIPFLPFEPRHIKKCIENAIGEAKLRSHKNLFEDVLFQVHCKPEDEYCPYGCKLVSSKAFIVLDRHEEL